MTPNPRDPVSVLVEALSHPGIKELPCECGFYEEDQQHICIKCFQQAALAQYNKSKGETVSALTWPSPMEIQAGTRCKDCYTLESQRGFDAGVAWLRERMEKK